MNGSVVWTEEFRPDEERLAMEGNDPVAAVEWWAGVEYDYEPEPFVDRQDRFRAAQHWLELEHGDRVAVLPDGTVLFRRVTWGAGR